MPRQKGSTPHAEWLKKSIRECSDECIFWPFAKSSSGYGNITFEKKTDSPHRVAYYLTHNRWPMPYARHTCDNRLCCNPSHIVEGTARENVADMYSRNRQPSQKGESNNYAKLTNVIIKKIRSEYVPRDPQFGQHAMARRYGIDQGRISSILARKIWKHVE